MRSALAGVASLLLLVLTVAGCARREGSTPSEGHDPPLVPARDASTEEDAAPLAGRADAAPTRIDPDGDDDPEDPGTGPAPAAGHFEKVGTPPLALTRICDLTPLGDALYAAHANQPLGTDGATITRYVPGAARPFTVAFDWNRAGEPTKGGGAGQGFSRVHAIGGRLFVPDNDPPYNGLGLVEYGTEGYVFVSDAKGVFAPPRAPQHRPPGSPDLRDWAGGKAGAGVLPRAYHVLDSIRFRGALYASTGSVPPAEKAWRGASPGALHRANEDGSRWVYETDYPFPWKNGVWRLTFMVRFQDRLYAGIQDYDGREPNDYVYFTPSSAPALSHEDAHPVRITAAGAAGTLRWWVDTRATPPRLYWIAWSRDAGIALRSTTDGDTWTTIPLPAEAGRPTDITRFRDAVVVLAERGLYRIDKSGTAAVIATVADKKTPFEVSDFFCAAPLAVFQNALYAGGQRGGTLYRLAED
ncbi:MAG: hypothetical protein JWP97_63 [Labilithrix sp.]|nr:hypothetical protein [Labilithrix sp.]